MFVGVTVWFCLVTWTAQVSGLLLAAAVTNKHFLYWCGALHFVCPVLLEKNKELSRVVLRRGHCPSPSSPRGPRWLFPGESLQLPRAGSACLTKAPCFSVACLFPPSWGAVLLEGPPATCLSLCPVGASGCTHSQGLPVPLPCWGFKGLLPWHHGFFF